MDCIFCRIAGGEVPATYVREDDLAVAINDVNPVAPTHVLIIPRQHLESVRELSDPSLLAHLFGLAHEIAAEMGIAGGGYRLVFNVGVEGGQTVSHVHLHLLGGRMMGWPPG